MDSQTEKIIIKIPPPPITSLIFEGGGVKGIAYAGAYKALKDQAGLLDKLHWVAGSSAGAMTALLVALDFTSEEIDSELSAIDFSEFAQSPPYGKVATINYIFKNTNKISKNINHGINDGKKLYKWVQSIVEKKLGTKEATFLDLKKRSGSQPSKNSEVLSEISSDYKNLFVIVTNALKNKTEIFSWETTPNLQISDAVLTSMSIPGFFYIRYIDSEKRKIDWNPTLKKISAHEIIPYVDGGVLNNYPINIFRDYKYWLPAYYGLVKSHHFNPSSLGIRVDSKEEVLDLIDIRHHEIISMQHEAEDKQSEMQKRMFSPSDWFISPTKIFGMASKFVTLLTSDLNKVEQYCQRTIAIYDCDIQTTQFNLTKDDKIKLKESGKKAVNEYFNEYFKKESFKKIIYDNISDLESDLIAKNELIKILSNLKDKHTHERELSRLKLEYKLSKEKLIKLDKKTSSRFFKTYAETAISKTHQDVTLSEVRGIQQQELTEKIEAAPSIEETASLSDEISLRLDKPSMPLKFDVENDEEQKPFFRRLFCC